MARKYPQIPDPKHAAYDAMSESQQAKHIGRHEEMVEAYVDAYASASGYRIGIWFDGAWGDSFRYTVKIHCIKHSFAVDRRATINDQMDSLERGLKALQTRYEHWKLEHELHKIFELHGVAESKG